MDVVQTREIPFDNDFFQKNENWFFIWIFEISIDDFNGHGYIESDFNFLISNSRKQDTLEMATIGVIWGIQDDLYHTLVALKSKSLNQNSFSFFSVLKMVKHTQKKSRSMLQDF